MAFGLTCRGTVAIALLASLASTTGCTSFGGNTDAIASYEATKRRLVQDAGPNPLVQASFEQAEEEVSISDFSPENLGDTVRELAGGGAKPEEAKAKLAEAQQLFQQATAERATNAEQAKATYIAAANTYRAAGDLWQDSTVEHDSLFMAGEAYFFADQYADSEEMFEMLLKKFPHSRHIDRIQPRRFAIAQYWLDLHTSDPQAFYEFNISDETQPLRDTFGHAIRVFDRIRLDDPTGKLADDATLAMANAFFNRGEFMRADEHYTDLRKTFPASEHQFLAHFLGLKCKLMVYQGPDYSVISLREADKLVKQIKRQFPQEAEREREYLNRAYAEVQYRLAEREWKMADYYDQKSEFGAARFYYSEILDNYADTPFGERAEARMREIGGRPATPPEQLSWLVRLFPDKDQKIPVLANQPGGTTVR